MTAVEHRAGRVPPHNIEAEESLLGAMCLSIDGRHAAVDAHLDASDFFRPANGLMFDAIMALHTRGEEPDPVQLAEQLRRAGVLDQLGGRKQLARIVSHTPASANAEHYAKIVGELSLLRRVHTAGVAIAELGLDPPAGPVREVLDQAETLVFEVADREVTHHAVPIASAVQEAISRLDGGPVDVLGVRSGYLDYDTLLLGLQPGTMNVVAGRPGMGKSSFAIGAAAHVAIEERRPALIFSMEMGTIEVTYRILAQLARVELRSLLRRDLNQGDWDRLTAATAMLADAPLFIVDKPHCTTLDIAGQARRAKTKHGDLGLVVVDYVQLMTASGRSRSENREREVAEFSRALKVLSLDLDCPVIACAQLNRGLESRNDKRPMLADLRETGALENDADVVTFIYRDEFYNPESDARGTAEIIVAKHRNGPTGSTRLAYLSHFTKFANMARD